MLIGALLAAPVVAGAALVAYRRHRRGAGSRNLIRLARLAQLNTSAVVVTDAKCVIVWVNDGFTRITGYSLEEAVGKIPGRLLQGPDTDRAEVARLGAAIADKTPVAGELVNYAKDGRRYWIGLKIEPLVNVAGEVEGFIAVQADITERHEQRLALDLLTSRFNLATRAAHIGIFEHGVDDREIWWNDVMYELVGREPATFRPTLASWLALIHPEDRDRVDASVGAVDPVGNSPIIQYRILRPDGQIRHLQTIGSSKVNPYDGVRTSAGFVLDITARMEFEQHEAELQRQLREIAHRAGMAEIITGVLHNVGNVLNSLGVANATARQSLKAMRVERLEQASAQLIEHRAALAAFLTEDTHGRHLPDYLVALSGHLSVNTKAVQAETDTIEQLIRHLRGIVSAQQASARVGGLRERLDLQDVAELALHSQASELACIEVRRIYEEMPQITTDRHKLLQILVNLIRNARDAVQAGPAPCGGIVIRIRRDGGHALISVEDSGVGMSAEMLPQLWRFGFTTKSSGHGFGLHSSAIAVRELGGTIGAHSAGVGEGSCFTVRLPIDDKPLSIHRLAS